MSVLYAGAVGAAIYITTSSLSLYNIAIRCPEGSPSSCILHPPASSGNRN